MSTVYYRHCDQCNAERREHLAVGWWVLRGAGEDDDYDFCSIACLEAWSLTRHLGTGTRTARNLQRQRRLVERMA